MPVNSTHADHDAALPGWIRARDLLAGEDAVKAAGVKYLPRLEAQTDEEYSAYRSRACFFNATRRAADAFVGLVFRKAPFVRIPEAGSNSPNPLPNSERATRRAASGIGGAMSGFANDADMLGTSLFGYAKKIVQEVVAVGRAGTLVDWEGDFEKRAYATAYRAEDVRNWRAERVNGRNVPTMIVLAEKAQSGKQKGEFDAFASDEIEQMRVLRLVPGDPPSQGFGATSGTSGWRYEVEVWRQEEIAAGGAEARRKVKWVLFESRVPLRLGRPLPLIPFVFHGPQHCLPDVDRMPLSDLMVLNLDHYRLDADFKHGLHYTALPTAWVAGFEKTGTLTIGSRVAWVSENEKATAGFLEFSGDGLGTFERAIERDERQMAVLGTQVLENQIRVAETATAIMLRQAGENSVLANIATSVSESLTQVMRWVYWWNSTEALPEMVTDGQVLVELNTDFGITGMQSGELAAVVKAWKDGAMSQDSMLELFRKREILPEGRSNADEARLIEAGNPKAEDGSPQAEGALSEGSAMGQEGVVASNQ
ncbi:MAG: DUF4055 domain-containing protein [Verrucomicrobiota bacterium]